MLILYQTFTYAKYIVKESETMTTIFQQKLYNFISDFLNEVRLRSSNKSNKMLPSLITTYSNLKLLFIAYKI